MSEYVSIKNEVVKKLEEHLPEIRERFGIEMLGVFGSVSRGEDKPDSDIDILILVDGDRLAVQDELAIMTPLYEIELNTGVLINPLILLKKEWGKRVTPFYENVSRDAVLI